MSDTMLDADNDLFGDLFNADGTWVLIKLQPLKIVGPFSSEEEAQQFKNQYPYLASYTVIEMLDPEDVILEQGNGTGSTA